jgi:bifunctional UDP-N-acetylglucosamine pyrophosphorylase/glucosamine-1-phosphate N-acetyltransferase
MRSRLPKVLQRLGGRPLLEHVLSLAAQLAPARVTVVHGHGAEQVRDAFPAPDLHWVLQDPPRGTGDAVRLALHSGDAPATGAVLVLYADVPLLQADSLAPLLRSAAGGALALLTQEVGQPDGYGRIVRDANGAVVAIVEHKDATASQIAIREINTGILAAPAARLSAWVGQLQCNNAQGEFYLTDVVAMAVASLVPVSTHQPGQAWEADGVNDPQQLAQLERRYQSALAGRLMRQGLRLADPQRFDVRGELSIGEEVEIDIGCVFEGEVRLERDVTIEPYCVLRNCTIGAGSRIRAFSHLDGVQTGPGCVVGPYARVRPGSVLGEGAHLGNFVEIKNSQIGAGSKANHLAYIGDATVGVSVNIGAGVITCNYDGANKHRTVIGDGAFIGSDAQLVAPVTVGAGATIGAGTTLVTDAPADQLTLSRSAQRSVPDWRRPEKS